MICIFSCWSIWLGVNNSESSWQYTANYGVSIRFTGCDYFFPYNEELQLNKYGPLVVLQQICLNCLPTVNILESDSSPTPNIFNPFPNFFFLLTHLMVGFCMYALQMKLVVRVVTMVGDNWRGNIWEVSSFGILEHILEHYSSFWNINDWACDGSRWLPHKCLWLDLRIICRLVCCAKVYCWQPWSLQLVRGHVQPTLF